MAMYESFAAVYDTFMDNVPYEEWGRYLIGLLHREEITEGLVLELGCGTGSMTELLAEAGYDMIGVDNSPDMLEIAMEKREKSGHDILYLLQDMREFELYGTVAAVVSICDSINYITEYEDLVEVFRLVNNYLDPHGIFVFDIKTRRTYEKIGASVIAEDREECSFIWDNYFDAEDGINEYQLSVFVKSEDGRYDKYVENHYQRAYSLEEIQRALRESGLAFVAAYNAFTKEDAKEDDERIYVVAREKMKSEK